MINKGELRAEIKMLFRDMPPDEKTAKSKKVFENLSAYLRQLTSQDPTIPDNYFIGAFAPLGDEVEWMFGPGEYSKQLSFPVMGGDHMIFRASSYEDLESKKEFGVEMKAPSSSQPEITPHILLVPGRAFSADGKRLGRGKGYYDKYMTNFNGKKIGLCLEDQVRETVPTEAHDINMDLIITDKNIYGEMTP